MFRRFAVLAGTVFGVVSLSVAAGDFRIDSYGARTDGTKCTAAFADALKAAVAAGGGRIVVPKGEWLTGPIDLASRVTLHLEEGATLLFTDDPADYPLVSTPHNGWICKLHKPLVEARDAEQVGITGKGLLTCRTERWWSPNFWKGDRRQLKERPHFILFWNCRDVLMDGFTVRESPRWTIHLYRCAGVTVRNLDVAAHGPNSDGIDIEHTRDVLLENCTFEQNDDAICFKAGRDAFGRQVGIPTENVKVRNCTISTGHTMFGFGSELSAGIRNVDIADCRVTGKVDNVFRFKTNPLRGGFVENVRIRNIKVADGGANVLNFTNTYFFDPKKVKGRELVPTRVSDIDIADVEVDKAERVVRVEASEDNPLKRIKFKNVRVHAAAKPDIVRNAEIER